MNINDILNLTINYVVIVFGIIIPLLYVIVLFVRLVVRREKP